MTEVRSVTVPPAVASAVADGAGARSSASSAKLFFLDEDPGLPLPPPPLGGEAAPRHDSEGESNDASP
eukprot:9260682-Pyramimonas_sp.AAC.1